LKEFLLKDIGCFQIRFTTSMPPNYFVSGQTNHHTLELMNAVRKGDLDLIRNLHTSGAVSFSPNPPANAYGETIVHTAARRGGSAIVNYLVNDAKASVRVCCDMPAQFRYHSSLAPRVSGYVAFEGQPRLYSA
jgi:hypothetical protein